MAIWCGDGGFCRLGTCGSRCDQRGRTGRRSNVLRAFARSWAGRVRGAADSVSVDVGLHSIWLFAEDQVRNCGVPGWSERTAGTGEPRGGRRLRIVIRVSVAERRMAHCHVCRTRGSVSRHDFKRDRAGNWGSASADHELAAGGSGDEWSTDGGWHCSWNRRVGGCGVGLLDDGHRRTARGDCLRGSWRRRYVG